MGSALADVASNPPPPPPPPASTTTNTNDIRESLRNSSVLSSAGSSSAARISSSAILSWKRETRCTSSCASGGGRRRTSPNLLAVEKRVQKPMSFAGSFLRRPHERSISSARPSRREVGWARGRGVRALMRYDSYEKGVIAIASP